MSDIQFEITMAEAPHKMKVKGDLIDVEGKKYGIFKQIYNREWGNYGFWVAVELSTGTQICDFRSKKFCISEAKAILKRENVQNAIDRVSIRIKKLGIALPLNKKLLSK